MTTTVPAKPKKQKLPKFRGEVAGLTFKITLADGTNALVVRGDVCAVWCDGSEPAHYKNQAARDFLRSRTSN